MRSVVLLTLIAILTFGLIAVAQEDQNAAGRDDFTPTEEVAADTAVAFPTDI